MVKVTCPITQKEMDCQNCEAIKDEKCPYMEFDKCVEYTINFLREMMMEKRNWKK